MKRIIKEKRSMVYDVRADSTDKSGLRPQFLSDHVQLSIES